MKKLDIMTALKEFVYQIHTNTRLQYVTWGGAV